MAVKSRDIDGVDDAGQGRPAEAHRPQRAGRGEAILRVYGAALLLFGIPFWPVAAWYLASGWAEIINAVLAFVRVAAAVPSPAGVYGLIAAGVVGAIYSRVELRPPTGARAWRSAALLWVVWAAVMGSDLWATFYGLARPNVLGGILAVVLTFGPDQGIMRGWRILNGRPPF